MWRCITDWRIMRVALTRKSLEGLSNNLKRVDFTCMQHLESPPPSFFDRSNIIGSGILSMTENISKNWIELNWLPMDQLLLLLFLLLLPFPQIDQASAVPLFPLSLLPPPAERPVNGISEWRNRQDLNWIELANVGSGICSASESSIGNKSIDVHPVHEVRCWRYLSW
jgi:hypothetical protein